MALTETFPFGRRQFRFELLPLIEWVASQSRIKLVCSIRDILQHRSEKREAQTVDIIKQYFDAVLVHADPLLFTLDASLCFKQDD